MVGVVVVLVVTYACCDAASARTSCSAGAGSRERSAEAATSSSSSSTSKSTAIAARQSARFHPARSGMGAAGGMAPLGAARAVRGRGAILGGFGFAAVAGFGAAAVVRWWYVVEVARPDTDERTVDAEADDSDDAAEADACLLLLFFVFLAYRPESKELVSVGGDRPGEEAESMARGQAGRREFERRVRQRSLQRGPER